MHVMCINATIRTQNSCCQNITIHSINKWKTIKNWLDLSFMACYSYN